jgi:hypothetical protein
LEDDDDDDDYDNMDQSPFEKLDGQEIPCLLWNQKYSFLCSKEHAIRANPEPDESSPQPHTLFKICCNITFPSMSRSPKWSLPFRFSDYIVSSEEKTKIFL